MAPINVFPHLEKVSAFVGILRNVFLCTGNTRNSCVPEPNFAGYGALNLLKPGLSRENRCESDPYPWTVLRAGVCCVDAVLAVYCVF